MHAEFKNTFKTILDKFWSNQDIFIIIVRPTACRNSMTGSRSVINYSNRRSYQVNLLKFLSVEDTSCNFTNHTTSCSILHMTGTEATRLRRIFVYVDVPIRHCCLFILLSRDISLNSELCCQCRCVGSCVVCKQQSELCMQRSRRFVVCRYVEWFLSGAELSSMVESCTFKWHILQGIYMTD